MPRATASVGKINDCGHAVFLGNKVAFLNPCRSNTYEQRKTRDRAQRAHAVAKKNRRAATIDHCKARPLVASNFSADHLADACSECLLDEQLQRSHHFAPTWVSRLAYSPVPAVVALDDNFRNTPGRDDPGVWKRRSQIDTDIPSQWIAQTFPYRHSRLASGSDYELVLRRSDEAST